MVKWCMYVFLQSLVMLYESAAEAEVNLRQHPLSDIGNNLTLPRTSHVTVSV